MQGKYQHNKSYKADLPYPQVEVGKPNDEYAKLIYEDYAGRVSELTAITQYVQQNVLLQKEYEEVANDLLGIAEVEMHHLKILAEVLVALGAKPKYGAYTGQQFKYWNASMDRYADTLMIIIKNSIEDENEMVTQYNDHIKLIQDKNIQEILRRIVQDEKVHIGILTALYHKYFR